MAKMRIVSLVCEKDAHRVMVRGNSKFVKDGLEITSYNNNFGLSYTTEYEKDLKMNEYPFVKIRYMIGNVIPSKKCKFAYTNAYTDACECGEGSLEFEIDGNSGEWNEMIFDFSKEEKWRGKLNVLTLFLLYHSNENTFESRDFTIQYIGFFSDKADAEAFSEKNLEYTNQKLIEYNPPIISSELGKDRIHIGAFFPYNPDHFDKDQIRQLAEAGVDFSLSYFHMNSAYMQKYLLDWYAEYGISAIVNDGFLHESKINYYSHKKKAASDWYTSHPAFGGHMFIDEPGTCHYDEIAVGVDDYNKDFPGKTPFPNLLPMYANNDQLNYGASAAKIDFYTTPVSNFYEYIEQYARKVDTPFICTDIYPCRQKTNGVKYTYEDYVKSIEIVAEICRKYNKEFWCYIQTFGCIARPFRILNESDIRWQAYSMLSFGCKNIIYYVYVGFGGYINTPVHSNGKRGTLWYACHRLGDEVKAISEAYLEYNNIGAFTHNCTTDTPYLNMINPLNGFDPIEEIRCYDPLLIGCFNKKEGNGYAITVVNMSEMEFEKTVNVQLKLKGKKITAYFGGKATEIYANGGYYTFDLVSGNGVFITIA